MAGDDSYFAAVPDDEVGARLWERREAHFELLKGSGRLEKILKSYATSIGATVNGTDASSWEIVAGGEQDELLLSVENHYRALGNSVINLLTAERPTIQCAAANSDSASLGRALLADGIVDFYLSKKGVEALLKRAVKRATYQTEAFVYVPWNVHGGEPYLPIFDEESGDVVGRRNTGDVDFFCLGPLDVVRDAHAESWEQLRWVMVRTWVSKYEMAAHFPELADAIHGLETKDRDFSRIQIRGRGTESDLIERWDFFHKPSAVLPEGRMVSLLSEKIVLYVGPNPYSDGLPVYPYFPDELDGTPYGDTPQLDLLGPQEAINAIDSQIITANINAGVNNYLVPRKANVSVESLGSSGNAIEYDGELEPKTLQRPEPSKSLYDSKAGKISAMEALVGVSSVTRGTPSESVGADASGSKLALLDAKSAQNNNSAEKAYVRMVRDVCGAILRRLRDFGGDVTRMVKLAGKANQYLVRQFVSSDLQDIDILKVEMANPVLRTTSGKMAVADKAVELGVIKPGQLDKYLWLLRTGQEAPLFEVAQAEQMRIRGENERLLQGEGIHTALISDPHWKEIPEHLALLANPALRDPTPENAATQQRVLAAVQQHIDQLLQAPPWLVMMVGGPEAMAVYQQVQAMMAPPPMLGAPGPTPPGGPAPGKSGGETALNPAGSKPEQPGMPSMPTQPNGEPAFAPAMELQ